MGFFSNIFSKDYTEVIEKAISINDKMDNLQSEILILGEERKNAENSFAIKTSRLGAELKKGGDDNLSFVQNRIKERHESSISEIKSSILSKTTEYHILKGELNEILKNKKVNDLFKSETEKHQIGSSYELIKEAFSSGIIDRPTFKEARKKAEKKLKNQVHYADMLVFNKKGELLLLQRSSADDMFPSQWCLPGGHVDPNEESIKASQRELEEEALITLTDEVITKRHELKNDKAFIEYFEVLLKDTPIVVLNSREHQNYEWVSIDKINDYDLILDLKSTLNEIFNIDKSIDEDIEKGLKAVIGERRKWKDGTYVKTANGWESVNDSVKKDIDKSNFKYSLDVNGVSFVTNNSQSYAGELLSPFESKGSFKATIRKNDLVSIAADSPELESYGISHYDSVKQVCDKLKNKGVTNVEIFKKNFVFEMRPLNDVFKQGDINSHEPIKKALDTVILGLNEGIIKYEDISKGVAHKYIKKEWVGDKWQYIYSDDKIEKAFQTIKLGYEEGLVSQETFVKALRVYSDNAENRKLNRVGQRWGSDGKEETFSPKTKKEEETPTAKESSDRPIEEYAKQTSDQALEQAAKGGDEELRIAAKKELERREAEHKTDETGEKKEEENSGKKEYTIKDKVEELSDKYKKTTQEAMNDDFSDSKKTSELSRKQKEYSRYIQRLGEFDDTDQEEEVKKAEEFFNGKSLKDISKMFGSDIISIKVSGKPLMGRIEVVTKDGYMSRTFNKNAETVKMNEFILDPDIEKGSGKGTDIFHNQVQEFKRLGFKKLMTHAAKSDVYNGYYTWARLGYTHHSGDSLKISDYLKESKLNKYSENVRNSKSVSELMSFKEGREFWKEYGREFEGVFNLEDDSESMFLLNKYMEEKKSGKK